MEQSAAGSYLYLTDSMEATMSYNRDGLALSSDSRSKRQQILEAAYIVFSRNGYHRATVDEIIALADTGKGTVYNYFVNKEQLFYTLIKERSIPFDRALEEIVVSQEPPMEKIKAMIKVFLEFYIVNADLWRVMMHEVRGFGHDDETSSFTQEQREKYHQGFHDTIGMLEKVLAEGVSKGVFRECDVVKCAHGLFSVIVMLAFQKMAGDVEACAQMIADMFLYGVAKQ
jgi:TetR/AcrR family transcriptional regulator